MKYIDAEKLRKLLANRYEEITVPVLTDEGGLESFYRRSEIHNILKIVDSLQREQTDMGEVSDGYHTFNELYYYRMLYNAAFFNLLPKEWVHKSKRHHTGEECFGGGWFIVMANLPTGQISNHYELKDWDLFQVPEKEFSDEWDGHTPQEAAERLCKYLQQEQPKVDLEKALNSLDNAYFDLDGIAVQGATHYLTVNDLKDIARDFYERGLRRAAEMYDEIEYNRQRAEEESK